jgi:hypothetical protein
MHGGAPFGRASRSCVSVEVLAGTLNEARTGVRAFLSRCLLRKGTRMTRSNCDLKRLIEEHTKVIFLLISLLNGIAYAQAATTIVTNQPPTHAGWEASKDVRLPIREANSRIFRAAITFTATASNNVQMAFGNDLDGDGKLPAEETSATIGWDRGAWFILSSDLLHKFTCIPSDANAVMSRTLRMDVRFSANGTPLSLSFKDGNGVPLVFDGLEGVPSWISPAQWDTAALTARGWDVRDEGAQISFILDGTQILLR